MVQALSREPCPENSKKLEFKVPGYELFRIRFEKWRFVYGISESDKAIDILAVRKRPPYDYGDLKKGSSRIQGGTPNPLGEKKQERRVYRFMGHPGLL